ncbi:hypothetical protein [Vibrio phage LV6]|nr:hypothetical protein [Vibrio phage LV6]
MLDNLDLDPSGGTPPKPSVTPTAKYSAPMGFDEFNNLLNKVYLNESNQSTDPTTGRTRTPLPTR